MGFQAAPVGLRFDHRKFLLLGRNSKIDPRTYLRYVDALRTVVQQLPDDLLGPRRTGFGVGCHDDVLTPEREVIPARGIEVMVVKVARLFWPRYRYSSRTHLLSLHADGKQTLVRRRQTRGEAWVHIPMLSSARKSAAAVVLVGSHGRPHARPVDPTIWQAQCHSYLKCSRLPKASDNRENLSMRGGLGVL